MSRPRHSSSKNRNKNKDNWSSSALPSIRIQNSDMPEEMLERAIQVAFQGLKKHTLDVDVAQYIKTAFDDKFQPVWMCVVGKSFGVYVTHQANHFAHFYIGQRAIVLFRGMWPPDEQSDKIRIILATSHVNL